MRIFRETSEAVQPESGFGGCGGVEADLIKDAARIGDKVDGRSAATGLYERPVLLEHLDDLEPVVASIDGHKVGHP